MRSWRTDVQACLQSGVYSSFPFFQPLAMLLFPSINITPVNLIGRSKKRVSVWVLQLGNDSKTVLSVCAYMGSNQNNRDKSSSSSSSNNKEKKRTTYHPTCSGP
jgi:hypothetical protein